MAKVKLTADGLKAAGDALINIILARAGGGGFQPPQGPTEPGQPINIEIDPNLRQPKGRNNPNASEDTPPMEIFDPKGVLQKLDKNSQKKQQQNKSDTIYHGPEDPKNKPDQGDSNGGGGEKGPDQPQPQQKGDTQGQQGQAGQGQQQGQEGSQGQQGGSQNSGSQGDKSDKAPANETAQQAADRAQQAADEAQEAADEAQAMATEAEQLTQSLAQSGSSKAAKGTKADVDKAKEAAKEAQAKADAAQEAADEAQEAADKGDAAGAKAAADKAEKTAQAAKQAADKTSQNQVKSEESAKEDLESEYRDAWNSTMSKFDNSNTDISDINKALKDAENNNRLSQTAKKAIKDALEIIKQSKSRPIELEQETVDDFKNRGLILPKNIKVREYDSDDEIESEEDKQARVDKINNELSGQNAQDLLDQIQLDNSMKISSAEKAEEEERRAQVLRDINKPASFDNFENDLYMAIQQQVTDREDDFTVGSYYKANPLSKATGAPYPGQIYPETKGTPLLVVYIDESGSLSDSDKKRGKEALKTLDEFAYNGEIDLATKYFSNHVFDNPRDAEREGGTHAFPRILEDIQRLGAENVVIMTDDDFDGQTNWATLKPIRIPGCVWWIWSNSRSRKAPDYLKGEAGNYQYWIS